MTVIQKITSFLNPFKPNKKVMLKAGDMAPDFDLPATGGKRVKLSMITGQGKNVLLVFYPMDNTPGCTIQLCSLKNDIQQFADKNTIVLGINPGSLQSHEGFSTSQELPFPIVVDEGKRVAKAYGVLGPIGIVNRSVFLIDKNNVIQDAIEGTQHNKSVLQKIDSL